MVATGGILLVLIRGHGIDLALEKDRNDRANQQYGEHCEGLMARDSEHRLPL
jgi:hypothetical protein